MRIYLLDLHRGRSSAGLTSLTSTNSNRSSNVAVSGLVCKVVDKEHANRDVIFVNRECRGAGIVVIGLKIEDPGLVGGTESLRHDEGRIVDRTDGPLVEFGLVGRRG